MHTYFSCSYLFAAQFMSCLDFIFRVYFYAFQFYGFQSSVTSELTGCRFLCHMTVLKTRFKWWHKPPVLAHSAARCLSKNKHTGVLTLCVSLLANDESAGLTEPDTVSIDGASCQKTRSLCLTITTIPLKMQLICISDKLTPVSSCYLALAALQPLARHHPLTSGFAGEAVMWQQ